MKIGGARRDRTADLLHAMQALSQLSYGPFREGAHYEEDSRFVQAFRALFGQIPQDVCRTRSNVPDKVVPGATVLYTVPYFLTFSCSKSRRASLSSVSTRMR